VQHGGASGTGYVKFPDDNVTVVVLTNLEQLAGGDGVGLAKVVAQAFVKGVAYAQMPGRADPDPRVGETLRGELARMAAGTMTDELYAPEFAKLIAPTLPSQKAGLAPLGPVRQVEYLAESKLGRGRSVMYRVRFDPVTLYAHLGLNADGKIDQMSLSQEMSIDE